MWARRFPSCLLTALLLAVPTIGCNQRGGAALYDDLDLGGVDLSDAGDLRSADGPEDLRVGADLAVLDLAMDLAVPDLAVPDLAMPDLSVPDLAVPDLAMPDLAVPDLRVPDLATPDLRPPPDMRGRPPCMRGTGFAAFRFHYSPGSGTNAIVDAFGLPDNTNWQAVPAFATSVVDAGNGGGINIAGGNWLLIRFSVAGLSRISGATFSIRGRSYSVGSSGSFEAWSPIYGSATTPINSVSNAWPYAWTSVDYTGFVEVGDPPGLTGIRLYARGNSNNLVINTVELCIDGS